MWCRLRPDLRPEVVEKEEIHPVKSAFLAVLTPFFWSLSVAGLCKLHTTTSIFISERVGSVGAISSYQKPELIWSPLTTFDNEISNMYQS